MVIIYCLPILIALGLLLNSYYSRVVEIGDVIFSVHQSTLSDPGSNLPKVYEQLNSESEFAELVTYFQRWRPMSNSAIKTNENIQVNNSSENVNNVSDPLLKNSNNRNSLDVIQTQLQSIWLSKSLMVLSFTLLPFLLMSLKLAFSTKLILSTKQRTTVAAEGFFMKFMISCIMAICWIYILNPNGRGAGTMQSYLIMVDLFREETLPLYLRTIRIEPIVAGLLGWYLHSLGYIFTKLTHHDVASAEVYSHLFKKFLLVYGIAIVLPATHLFPDDKVSLVVFLLGFFPLAAFSLLKEQVSKFTNSQQKDGYLSILPGISRWQILRLEEEGIDTMAELAAFDRRIITVMIPSIAQVVDYWVDIAQLYVIVGHDNYLIIKQRCTTASGFIKLSNETDFAVFIRENKLGDCGEVADNLLRTFTVSSLPSAERFFTSPVNAQEDSPQSTSAKPVPTNPMSAKPMPTEPMPTEPMEATIESV